MAPSGPGLSDFVQFDDETILWTASLILLKHLQEPKQREKLRGKRILELGSGLGHLGMGLCRLGARVTCTERPKELPALLASIERQQGQTGSVLETALALLTGRQDAKTDATVAATAAAKPADTSAGSSDTPSIVLPPPEDPHQASSEPHSEAVANQGEPIQGSIQAVALEWGQEGFERSPLSTQQLPAFDYIICSELYYIESLFPHLLWTLNRFAEPGRTVVWSVFIDRPFSFMFLAQLHDDGGWDVESVEGFDDLGLDKELQVHMHVFKRR